MRLTSQQVRYFLAAVREKNFTRAARSCGVKQPTLSQCLRDLESALGGTLFERASHGVRLTPLGRAVRPHLAAIGRSAAKAGEAARTFCRSHEAESAADRGGPALATGGESAGLVG